MTPVRRRQGLLRLVLTRLFSAATSDVQEWMKELDGFNIPDIPVTTGDCAGSPNATANAAVNGWWTCGGHTRPTDITACPDKMTWGVSFDDGPSPYSKPSYLQPLISPI